MILLFMLLIMLGIPIYICMGASSAMWLLCSDVPGFILAQKMFGQTDSFSLMAIPFFMLAGQLMETTGITEGIMKFANSLVGHIKGGLAHTATLTGMIMAGVSGSANADGAAIGAVMLPALKRSGYEDGQAVSIVAAAGALGPIIPPSIFMVILANATGTNVGDLFLSGLIPGIIMGVGFMIVNYLYARKKNVPVSPFLGFQNIWKTFQKAIWALLMPMIILGGILMGVFTATEAGAVASLYGILYGICIRKLNLNSFINCLVQGVLSSVGPMLLIASSGVFAYMLTTLGTDKIVADFVLTYIPHQRLFLFFILLLGLLLGCFIDSIASCLMLMPILMPIVAELGIDFSLFAIVFSISFLTCTITPPVGTLLYVVCGVDGTPVTKTIRPIIPYVLTMAIIVILIIFFPGLGIWLPSVL